eukprot:jgi/Mesen1/3114/ME000184S02179
MNKMDQGTPVPGKLKRTNEEHKPFAPYHSAPHTGSPSSVLLQPTRSADVSLDEPILTLNPVYDTEIPLGKQKGQLSPPPSPLDAGKVLTVQPDLQDALTSFPQTFVISDATQPDSPIMYASEGFYKMTGYSPKEVIGRNCRFLQGPDTDRKEVAYLKEAVQTGQPYCGRLLNYRKDGSTFWNLLTVNAVKDSTGTVIKYIGMQVEVSKYTEGTKDQDVRPNNMPVSLIKYDGRQKDLVKSAAKDLAKHLSIDGRAPPRSSSQRTVSGDLYRPRPSDSTTQQRKSGLLSQLGMTELAELANAKHTPSGLAEERGPKEEEEDAYQEQIDRKARRGIDLATTLERIQKNFVITDPRLPDNPIIYASDDFLELTEYSREEILGRNCRFLQGPDTDPKTVQLIREAVALEKDITVQLLNYTKSGNKFWNLFHMQCVKDKKGELQYFIGVQLDASEYVEPEALKMPETIQLPDVETTAQIEQQLTANPKPHKANDPNWNSIMQVRRRDGQLRLRHFRPIKPLGSGDTGSVHLVELRDTGKLFAMKAMDKDMMVKRNKVHRAVMEREVLGSVDHPFLPTLGVQTASHLCLITEFCARGELYLLLQQQKGKRFPEATAKFYASEVLLALEYLHCQGVVYRDLKPENILLREDGHLLIKSDLPFPPPPPPPPPAPPKGTKEYKQWKKAKKEKAREKVVIKWEEEPRPEFFAEPVARSNSFVGTEEYIAPEIITGDGHSSPADWWAFGIFLYEMLYGRTPFRGATREKTFTNVLSKEVHFPASPQVSAEAKDMIRGLLARDPAQRLGARKGATLIKQHAFFRGTRWAFVRNQTPPRLDVPAEVITSDPGQQKPTVEESEDEGHEWDETEGATIIFDDF